MDTKALIQSLLTEIAQDEAALEKKRMVVEFLRERLPRDDAPVDLDSLPEFMRPRGSAESLLESISKALMDFGDREFTVTDVHEDLVRRGIQFQSSTPKASIATALGRLVQTGGLLLVFKGTGKTPNRFRRADMISPSLQQPESEAPQ